MNLPFLFFLPPALDDSRVSEYEFAEGWRLDDWDDDANAVLEFHLFDVDDDGYIQDVPDLRHLFRTFDTNGKVNVCNKIQERRF